MDIDLNEALSKHFGFETFKDGQRQVIEHLLAGRSAAAVFPTGGGKSLTYQLPALLLPGLTVVVSPLIALMKDQIDALAARGIAAQRLDSTLDVDAYQGVINQVWRGALRLLYVAPERFNNERFREVIRRVEVSLFAVDEAHCISEWGHNFRPDYLKLAQFARQAQAGRVLALTATATDGVLKDICKNMQIDPSCAIRTGFYRSNLTVLTTPVDDKTRDARLLNQLRTRPPGPTIVYVTLQRTAQAVARRLADAGFDAKPYHAGLKSEQREATQDWFIASGAGVVAATIAFGMGIDKADIRYVYHYNMPKSLEHFSQEIGRAGRDGLPSTCQMFFCPDDLPTLENFIYGDTPAATSVQSFIADIFANDESFDVSIYELSYEHDIRPLVIRTLLTYLELRGFLEGGTPVYATYRFKPNVWSGDILAHFDGDRRAFVAGLLAQAQKRRTWFTLDVQTAADALGCGRDKVVRALDYLGQQKWLTIESAGVRHRYRRVERPGDIAQLAGELYETIQRREQRELGRLRQVVDLVEHDGCQVSALGAYFAEPLDQPCGHCSNCLGPDATAIASGGGDDGSAAAPGQHVIDPGVLERARRLQSEHPHVLTEARSLAGFLCGLSSPKLIRAKLTHDPLFGALARVRLDLVRQRVSFEGNST